MVGALQPLSGWPFGPAQSSSYARPWWRPSQVSLTGVLIEVHHSICLWSISGPHWWVPKVFETDDPLHCDTLDEDGGVCSLCPPFVHHHLLSLSDTQSEVVILTLGSQGSHVLSVGHLISGPNSSKDDWLIIKTDNAVGAMSGHTVIQDRTEHTALENPMLSVSFRKIKVSLITERMLKDQHDYFKNFFERKVIVKHLPLYNGAIPHSI